MLGYGSIQYFKWRWDKDTFFLWYKSDDYGRTEFSSELETRVYGGTKVGRWTYCKLILCCTISLFFLQLFLLSELAIFLQLSLLLRLVYERLQMPQRAVTLATEISREFSQCVHSVSNQKHLLEMLYPCLFDLGIGDPTD